MENSIAFKTVKVPIEITVVIPVIEGKTDLRQEIENTIDNMVEICGYNSWEFNGHYEVIG